MNTLKFNPPEIEKKKKLEMSSNEDKAIKVSIQEEINVQSSDEELTTTKTTQKKETINNAGIKKTEETVKTALVDNKEADPKKVAKVKSIQLDLVSDSENSSVSNIAKAQIELKEKMLSMRAQMGGLDLETKKQWRKSEIYLSLSKQAQEDIEKNNDLKKMYSYVASDNVKGLKTMMSNGHLYPDMINMNNGFALKMAANNGSTTMLKTLCIMGGNPYSIDPKNCFTQEVAEIVIQERYKIDNSKVDLIEENFNMPRPRFM